MHTQYSTQLPAWRLQSLSYNPTTTYSSVTHRHSSCDSDSMNISETKVKLCILTSFASTLSPPSSGISTLSLIEYHSFSVSVHFSVTHTSTMWVCRARQRRSRKARFIQIWDVSNKEHLLTLYTLRLLLQGPTGKPGLPGMPGADGPPVCLSFFISFIKLNHLKLGDVVSKP